MTRQDAHDLIAVYLSDPKSDTTPFGFVSWCMSQGISKPDAMSFIESVDGRAYEADENMILRPKKKAFH